MSSIIAIGGLALVGGILIYSKNMTDNAKAQAATGLTLDPEKVARIDPAVLERELALHPTVNGVDSKLIVRDFLSSPAGTINAKAAAAIKTVTDAIVLPPGVNFGFGAGSALDLAHKHAIADPVIGTMAARSRPTYALKPVPTPVPGNPMKLPPPPVNVRIPTILPRSTRIPPIKRV